VNYDELSGVELAVAVAERQGWRLFKATDPRGMDVWVNDIKGGFEFKSSAYHYRPDQRIEQAWGLLKGMAYDLHSHPQYRSGQTRCFLREYGASAWANTPAEAICRAYLKATDPEVAR
jgi:hypothetical protein